MSKLPTAEQFYIEHASSKNIPTDFYVNEITEIIESHTASHTAALREDNAKLAHFNEVINTECTRIRIELGEEGGRVAALRDTVKAMGDTYIDLERRYIKSERLLIETQERVKDLGGSRKSDCIAFANWLSNQVLGGRSIEKLWRDYETEVLQ